MFKIVGCVVTQHDLRLVLVAAVISLFACATFTHMLVRMRAASGRSVFVWLAAAAFVAACGIWGTRLIAMLAFQPGFPVSYYMSQTPLSGLIAIILCAVAFRLFLSRAGVVGGGIAMGRAITMLH